MEQVDKLLAMYDSYIVREHSSAYNYAVTITLVKTCWYKFDKTFTYNCYKNNNKWYEREDCLDMRKRCLRHFGY